MNDCTLPRSPARRVALLATTLLAGAWLAGCASFNSVQSEVSSYGNWPAGRAAGSFVIDRLPSQQTPEARDEQTLLEQGAQVALLNAGFRPVAEGATPDVRVQIGARVTRQDRAPWDDPLWFSGPFGHGSRFGPGWRSPYWASPYGYGYSPFWGPNYRNTYTEYQREVAVLIRDGSSGEALYEAHARSDGLSSGGPVVMSAMFAAALQRFPAVEPAPRTVSVALP